jgi:hypothetical protein
MMIGKATVIPSDAALFTHRKRTIGLKAQVRALRAVAG